MTTLEAISIVVAVIMIGIAAGYLMFPDKD
jgi:hypothetical protein